MRGWIRVPGKVALAAVAGGVINVLVSWGIGWYGVPLPLPRVVNFRVGERVVEVEDYQNKTSRLLIWNAVDPPIHEGKFITELGISRFSKNYVNVADLVCEPDGSMPRWATFADPAQIPPAYAWNGPPRTDGDLELGWPMRSFCMRGVPSDDLRGGLYFERIALGARLRVLPYRARMPGLVVNIAFYGVVVAAGVALMREGLRRVRRQPWQCRSCRYDRRGLAGDAACPECGAAS